MYKVISMQITQAGEVQFAEIYNIHKTSTKYVVKVRIQRTDWMNVYDKSSATFPSVKILRVR